MPYVISCACGVAVQGDSRDEVLGKAEAHQEDHEDESVAVPRDVLARMIEQV